MNWEALSAIAGLLGAIGVIVTLIYLSVQIRQNNNQLRGSATIAIYEYQRTLTEMLSDDPELYKIALRGNEDLSSLNLWEQQRYTIWCIHETGMWELCHSLLKQGALDTEIYHGREDYWLKLHSSPGRRDWWNTHSVMLNDNFYREVSLQLKDIPIKRLSKAVPIFDSSDHNIGA